MGFYLLNQSVPGAALHLLQNAGPCQDVSTPVLQYEQSVLAVSRNSCIDKSCIISRSLYVNMVGLWVTVSLAVFSGLTMYSIYKNCDPLSNGDVTASDQVNMW